MVKLLRLLGRYDFVCEAGRAQFRKFCFNPPIFAASVPAEDIADEGSALPAPAGDPGERAVIVAQPLFAKLVEGLTVGRIVGYWLSGKHVFHCYALKALCRLADK